ncbi:MAG: aspartate-semialdehyde dehydrogenase [Chitinophagales bacterium]|jgi:aspartate-semialdehyde dehydrogenase|nr:aspartate-semialdehyde dehydrogenase [Sphingobacteriales bacterium]
MRIAVVGATGLVGQKMLQVLAERNFPVTELIPVASERSVGKEIEYQSKKYKIVSMQDAIDMKPQIALFSAGGFTSLEWAPKFAEVGTTVIDNSSAWRMHPEKKLVVPEVNAYVLTKEDKIIANPNCSTIQLVVALKPLSDDNPMKRVVVSTYQSVTGTGVKAVTQMQNERNGIQGDMAYKYQIDMNLIPQIDVFLENGYTKEEQKIMDETKKIMQLPHLKITTTTVRVPVMGGHSESVNIEFTNPVDLAKISSLLANFNGIKLLDNPSEAHYPMPITAHDNDYVWVGRIRRDDSADNAINLWIVSDNLRKGAATNAVQIAEYLVSNELI